MSLRRIEVIPDVVGEIAARVRALAGTVDHLFTSGGVGPTHDDVTLEAVARGLRHADRAQRGAGTRCCGTASAPRCSERDLRMADVPAGARLEHGPGGQGTTWPVVVVRNVWILPGVPSIFRRKFEAVRELFRAPPISRPGALLAGRRRRDRRRARRDGGRVSRASRSARTRTSTRADYRVKITLDGRDAAAVDRAAGLPGRRAWETAVAKTRVSPRPARGKSRRHG